jgi:hypothetical protein
MPAADSAKQLAERMDALPSEAFVARATLVYSVARA